MCTKIAILLPLEANILAISHIKCTVLYSSYDFICR